MGPRGPWKSMNSYSISMNSYRNSMVWDPQAHGNHWVPTGIQWIPIGSLELGITPPPFRRCQPVRLTFQPSQPSKKPGGGFIPAPPAPPGWPAGRPVRPSPKEILLSVAGSEAEFAPPNHPNNGRGVFRHHEPPAGKLTAPAELSK